jgi:spore germination protein YaaH
MRYKVCFILAVVLLLTCVCVQADELSYQQNTVINLEKEIIKGSAEYDTVEERLTLGWDYISSRESNKYSYDSDEDYLLNNSEKQGMKIISPTWFRLKWGNSKPIYVKEIIDENYLKIARKNGYEVWPCFQQFCDYSIMNSMEEYNKLLESAFKDKEIVKALIAQIVYYAQKYEFEGINIDFEAMGKINRDNYTFFIKNLAEELHRVGVKISVDVNEPALNSAYSECYDRKELAKYADYIIFMAYDEHWVGDINSGSVASYNWVENGIKKILSLGVPEDKLILAVPFYTRDFAVIEVQPEFDAVVVINRMLNGVETKLYDEASIESEVLKECTYKDTFKYLCEKGKWYEVEYNNQKAYIQKGAVKFVAANQKRKFAVGWFDRSMEEIDEIIDVATKEANVKYDEATKQDKLVYYEYDKAHTIRLKHEVWIENKKSMKWRIELAQKYDLKGIAAWRLGFENPEIWDMLGEYSLKSDEKALDNVVSEEDKKEEKDIKLYFSGYNAEYLEPEIRKIKISTPKKVIEELIKGPINSNLSRTLPESTKVISVEVKDKIAYVNFSKNIGINDGTNNNYGSSSAATMLLNSIVNTLVLCDEFDINKVHILIEGKNEQTLGPLDISEPIGANKEYIKDNEI